MFLWKQKSKRCKDEFSSLEPQAIQKNSEFYMRAREFLSFHDIYRRGKDIEKRKDGMSNCEINEYLQPIPNFLGVIFDDHLRRLSKNTHGFVIVNLDDSRGPGTHWIALGIFKNTVEFFDPLGCDFLNWPNLPIGLLNYIFKISFDKTVIRINRLQSSKSAVCGLYCIFYVMHRRNYSLQTILNYFDGSRKENDRKLVQYFK